MADDKTLTPNALALLLEDMVDDYYLERHPDCVSQVRTHDAAQRAEIARLKRDLKEACKIALCYDLDTADENRFYELQKGAE